MFSLKFYTPASTFNVLAPQEKSYNNIDILKSIPTLDKLVRSRSVIVLFIQLPASPSTSAFETYLPALIANRHDVKGKWTALPFTATKPFVSMIPTSSNLPRLSEAETRKTYLQTHDDHSGLVSRINDALFKQNPDVPRGHRSSTFY